MIKNIKGTKYLKGLIFAMAIAKSQYMDLPCVNTNRFTTGEELI